jgi:hypothetical protein
MFLLHLGGELVQILTFKVENCIQTHILPHIDFTIRCQFLLKVLASRINFHINSLYIV